MGKGARNRRNPRGRKPAATYADYMAPDMPLPERNTVPWAERVVGSMTEGSLFLLHYLAAVDDSQGVPTVAEPKEPVTDEEFAERTRLNSLLARLHVHAADWTPQITDAMAHIRPSDATHVVEAITEETHRWCSASGYTSLIGAHISTIDTLLDALCPPERREHAAELLRVIADADGEVDLLRTRHMLLGAATSHPFEAIHLAAALGAALYQTPACVPDPNVAQLELAQRTERYARGEFD